VQSGIIRIWKKSSVIGEKSRKTSISIAELNQVPTDTSPRDLGLHLSVRCSIFCCGRIHREAIYVQEQLKCQSLRINGASKCPVPAQLCRRRSDSLDLAHLFAGPARQSQDHLNRQISSDPCIIYAMLVFFAYPHKFLVRLACKNYRNIRLLTNGLTIFLSNELSH
jgi:hypothetical protein